MGNSVLEIRNLKKGFDGNGVLDGISLAMGDGEVVVVVGPSGCGKSTLLRCVNGLETPDSGEILLDGAPIGGMDMVQVRRQIGMVPQKATLFKGTIRQNLCWGKRDATEEELWRALEIAQAADVVRSKDGGLDAAVEQGGTNFSGGQRQRLTIARALVRKPSVLILDDSTSAVDTATDAAIREGLRTTLPNSTKIIIAQRIISVMDADLILVLDDGAVVGQGKHEELMETCAIYREVYESQQEGVEDNG